MQRISHLLLTLAFAAGVPLSTVSADNVPHTLGADVKSAAAAMSEGEIKKVDQEAGKITIKHGPLANLDMPAMTMVFRVKDPAMLGQVQPGDKIKFTADKVNGALTVTALQKQSD